MNQKLHNSPISQRSFDRFGRSYSIGHQKLTRIGELIALTLALLGCAPGISQRQLEWGTVPERPSLLEGPFEKLWTERTIVLGHGGGRSFFNFPGLQNSGAPRHEPFPLMVRATLMDSILVESGIQQFSELASMTGDELQAFRSRYRAQHDLENNLFIWMEWQTFYTDEILELDRWVIFLEDVTGQQYEPVRVVEHDRKQQPGDRLGMNWFPFSEPIWTLNTKVLELYFPKNSYDGTPLLSADTRTLKLVLFEWNNKNVRAEGSWDFSLFKNY